MKIDLHVHTKYSVHSTLEPREIVELAIKRGLNGIAVTDHNTIRGGLEAKRYETKDFKVIVGSEIKTDKGEVIGLFLKKEVQPGNFYDVVAKIKAQGGVVILPHPFDRLRGYFNPKREILNHIDCIEVFNSRSLLRIFNKKAKQFAIKHNIKQTAGSDTHFKSDLGKAYIEIDNFNTKQEFLKNLKNARIRGRRTLITPFLTKLYKIKLRIRPNRIVFK